MQTNLATRPRIRFSVAVVSGALLAILTLSMMAGAVAVPIGSGAGLAVGTAVHQAIASPSASPLQREIDSAVPGSTIHLPPGLFVGQIVLAFNVTLLGAGVGKTIVEPAATMNPDSLGNVFVIEIEQGATVQISAMTVRVTEQCMLANSIGVATGGGVGVRDNSTLNIWNVAVVAYGPSPNLDQPCTTGLDSPGMYSFGRAVSIGLDDPPGVGAAFQVEGHGTISHVHTQGFDIFSLSVGGVRGPSGSTATITNNIVLVGPGPYTAAYGIVAYGVSTISHNVVVGVPGSDGGIAVVFTSALVTDNVIRNFTCTNAPFPITPPCGIDPLYDDQDLGIFLASITPGTVVEHNAIYSVDAGILVEGPGAPATIIHNTVRNSTFYGLDLIDANQTFEDDTVIGGPYGVAVGAANSNSTAVLLGDKLGGFTVGLALLEANYPWVANVIVL